MCQTSLIVRCVVTILQCYVCSADLRVNEPFLGPYKEIYPSVDITQDQQNCSVAENGTCPLYVALMVSFGGEFDSSGVIPGVQMAIDQINNDPTVLPGYTLHYTLTATRVSNLSVRCLYLMLCCMMGWYICTDVLHTAPQLLT